MLSDERKAVARLERCFERCRRPASTLRCPKSERLDYQNHFIFPSRIHARARITFPVSRATLTHGFLMFIHSFPPPFSPFSRVLPAFRLLLRARLFTCRRAVAAREIVHILAGWCGNHNGHRELEGSVRRERLRRRRRVQRRQQRATRPHQRVLPLGLGRHVRISRRSLQPQTRRDRLLTLSLQMGSIN